jgi:hypothetical protein
LQRSTERGYINGIWAAALRRLFMKRAGKAVAKWVRSGMPSQRIRASDFTRVSAKSPRGGKRAGAGRPRELAAVTCPRCGAQVAASQIQKHVKNCKGEAV